MASDIKERIRRVVGSQKLWAEATGQNVEHVSRIVNGKYPVPEWWYVVLELLDVTAPADRSERWK